MGTKRNLGIDDGAGWSRRRVLKAGLGAGAALAAPMPAYALGVFDLGTTQLMSVSDGGLVLPISFVLPDVPQEELQALLISNGLPTDEVRPDCNVSVMRHGSGVVVFDAGSGSNFMPTAGKLIENLAEAGVAPEEVTDVIFTHAHPDHIWGVTDDFDDLVFPNATYHMSEAEFAFWSSDDAYAAVPESRQSFVAGAQARLEAIGDRLTMIKSGAEVVPGVEVVETHGHTPGHLSFIVHGGGEQVMIIGDAISHYLVSFMHPEWPYGADQDVEMGIKTRSALLDRLAGDKVHLIGYHLPHPGEGRVERAESGFRFAVS